MASADSKVSSAMQQGCSLVFSVNLWSKVDKIDNKVKYPCLSSIFSIRLIGCWVAPQTSLSMINRSTTCPGCSQSWRRPTPGAGACSRPWPLHPWDSWVKCSSVSELLNTEVTERDRTSPLDYALGNAKTKNACCLVQPQRNKVKWPLRCDKICDEGKKVKEEEEEGE